VLTDDFLTFDLNTLIQNTITQYETSGIALEKDTFTDVRTFILDRFYHFMRDIYTHDTIKAVTNILEGSSLKLYLASKHIEAFSQFSKTEQGEKIQQAYRRAQGVYDGTSNAVVVEEMFQSEEEKVLFDSVVMLEKQVQPSLDRYDYNSAMQDLVQLQKPINNFFENVMVNAEDRNVANNRKALLYKFTSVVRKIADF
tara:strand:- start:14 stop:607 length:594 start_codon:yes stop_codon:yes gene_type:complete